MTRTEYIQQHAPSFVAAALHITQLREAQAYYATDNCDSEKKKRDIVYLCSIFAAMQADVFGLTDAPKDEILKITEPNPSFRASKREQR